MHDCIVGLTNSINCSYSFFIYPVFLVSVFRLLRICITVFFVTFLLLLIYNSALLKQGSGAMVRFSDSSSLISNVLVTYTTSYWIISIFLIPHVFKK